MQPYQLKKSYELASIFLRRLRRDLYCGSLPMYAAYAAADSTDFKDCLALDYHTIAPQTVWGRNWQTGWFRFIGSFSEPTEKCCVPVIRINTGSEALLYSSDGKALSGLTAFCWFENDFIRDLYYPEESAAAPGTEFVLYTAVTANKLAGMTVDYDPDFVTENNGDFDAVFNGAETLWMRKEVKELMLDLECLLSLASTMAEDDYRRRRIARALDAAENTYADTPDNAAAARNCLKDILATEAYADALSVSAVGHSHLDTAYMWRVKEGIQKCGRTFATQLELIEHDPDYIFGASQPQHYAFVKKHFPEIYERIKKAVAANRWELQGGMWVEADTNIPNGEALVRQFLHGKNYFYDEFGIEVRNLWLPDVFGYSAALPQIMKLARCESYVSIKLAFSDCNKFPYKTFRWRGIDNSEVLGHLPPEGFYSSFLKPESLCKAEKEYSESAETGEFLSLFGMGDGGAGATRDDVAAGRRLQNLAGAPKLKFEAAQPLLDRLMKHWDDLPVWHGEIYLERHRGAATSIARCKRGNRKNEELLAAAEFISSMLILASGEYPIKKFDRAWKLLLLNQFHDIIAGTSLDETYVDTLRDYAEIEAICQENINSAANKLPQCDKSVTLVNTLNTVWSGTLEMPEFWQDHGVVDSDGRQLPARLTAENRVQAQITMQPLECKVFRRGGKTIRDAVKHSTMPMLENDLIRYTFNNDMQLISAYDKIAEKELFDSERMAGLRLFRDYPNNYEAWDIDRHYRERQPEIPHNTADSVEIRSSVCMTELYAELSVGNSIIRQKVSLAANTRLLTFAAVVDWHEKRKMLRAVFPCNISADSAVYDIQFGNLRRPTHENTSWDLAKFEVAHHKYMALADSAYGIALLNDCKYGGKVWNDTLELTLLRATRFPALNSEEGIQVFNYGLLPYMGSFNEGKIPEIAEAFNRAPVMLAGRDGSGAAAPIKIDTTAVVLSACKRAEKSNDLIIRLVERYGSTVHATLTWQQELYQCAGECDLLEWQDGKNFFEDKLDLQFRAFEVKTIRLKRRNP